MNNNSKYLLGSGVILAIVVACVALYSTNHSVAPVTPPIKTVTLAGGAPDLSNSPYLDVNGMLEWYSQQQMVSNYSTSTVCAIQNPVTPNASSTLQYFSARFGLTPSASSTTYWIATSTSPYATTTATVAMATGTVASSTANGWIPTTFGSGALMGSTTYTLLITNALTPIIGGVCQEEVTQY